MDMLVSNLRVSFSSIGFKTVSGFKSDARESAGSVPAGCSWPRICYRQMFRSFSDRLCPYAIHLNQPEWIGSVNVDSGYYFFHSSSNFFLNPSTSVTRLVITSWMSFKSVLSPSVHCVCWYVLSQKELNQLIVLQMESLWSVSSVAQQTVTPRNNNNIFLIIIIITIIIRKYVKIDAYFVETTYTL